MTNTIASILDRCEMDLITGCCWVWLDACHDFGYGCVSFEGHQDYVHRIIYRALVGPIPEGYVLHHNCHNRPCCNPRHLDPMTQGEHLLQDDTFISRNAAKTHCIKGHPLEGDNVYYRARTKRFPNGGRHCRTCHRDREREAYRNSIKDKVTVRKPPVTHCKHGHPYDAENTHITPGGNRHCRACDRIRHQAAYLWKKANET